MAVLSCSACSSERAEKSTTGDTSESSDSSELTEREELDRYVLEPPRLSLKEAMSTYLPAARSDGAQIRSADYLEAGIKAMNHRDYESAELILCELIKRDPENGKAYQERGRARLNGVNPRDSEALEDFKEALRLGVKDVVLYDNLARVYDGKKSPTRAIAILSEGLGQFPRSCLLLQNRAAQYLELKNVEMAIADYNKILAIDPRNSYIYLVRGQLFESLGRDQEALSDYKNAITYERKSIPIQLGLQLRKARGVLLGKTGKHKEAVDQLGEAIATDRSDDEAYRLRGLEYEALEDYPRALSDYDKSIELAPDFARESYVCRARVYELIGKKDQAAKDREKARHLKETPAERPVY
ncbi:MAG: tetratricopeptide repeat protein [Cyanobacteria bacterium HKST-UBA02]|nr:tetratricopeptide repeat protein [Cyanobacteria bacterium HKST-UBA02]